MGELLGGRIMIKKFNCPTISTRRPDQTMRVSEAGRYFLRFNAKIGFEKYASSPEILAKIYPNLAFQAKCQNFLHVSQ